MTNSRRLASAVAAPWTWRMAWRDSRSQRRKLALFAVSIVFGIAALVAIRSLKSNVEDAVAAQKKSLLGADVKVSSRDAFSPAADAALQAVPGRQARETSFTSTLLFPKADTARLVEVRALDGVFPFYGNVESEPAAAWSGLQAAGGILVEPALLDQLGVKPGDPVKLGNLTTRIAGAITKSAPRSNRFAAFAPQAYIRASDLPQTGLLGASSLASTHAFFELRPGADGAAVAMSLRSWRDTFGWDVETADERGESLGDALDNFYQYLNLIGLTALLLGGIGVGSAIHVHVRQRVSSAALLRCLGASGAQAFAIYLVQGIALGFLGAIAGAALGVGIQQAVPRIFAGSLPIPLAAPVEWRAVAEAMLAGMLICCGFALLPLLRVRKIPPLAALRSAVATDSAAARDPLRLAVHILLALGIAGFTISQSSSWQRGLAAAGALGVAFLLLALAAVAAARLSRALSRQPLPYVIRQGLSNLHRPNNQTRVFLFAVGLGTFLVLTLLLNRDLLLRRIAVSDAITSPNLYLVDVQPDQVAGVTALVESLGLPVLEKAAMITMRIRAVNGRPVAMLLAEKSMPDWVLKREYRSTFRDNLTASESLVEGEFIGRVDPAAAGRPQRIPVSLEHDLARDLKIGPGGTIDIDVQGVPLALVVTSIRKVDWSRFTLNFFMVFPAGALEGAPAFHVLTTRIPDDRSSGPLQRELARSFPNVSPIDLKLILSTVRGVLDKIGWVIRFMAGFTVASGFVILVGAVLNGRGQRVQEAALLRTLGASGRQIRAILLTEYSALGLLAATTGCVLALAAHAALARFLFKAPFAPSVATCLAVVLTTTMITILVSRAMNRGVLTHPPLETLRTEGGA